MWDFFKFLPFILVNRRGSLLLPTTGLTVSATAATFTLPSYRVSGPRGTMLIKISQAFPDGATSTLPIVFTANGGTQAATKAGGGHPGCRCLRVLLRPREQYPAITRYCRCGDSNNSRLIKKSKTTCSVHSERARLFMCSEKTQPCPLRQAK